MPCLNVSTNVNLDGVDTSAILADASSTVAFIIGKPEAICLSPSEYLTQVSGTTGSFWGINNVVKSLTFVTNIASYGPFGKDDGENQFVVRARRNSCIVGFFGNGGALVDSVGFYTHPL